MAEYILTYYDILGVVEPIRLIFALAGVPYEDVRIPKNDNTYPVLPREIKERLPWGQLPVLEFEGKILAQSGAVSRFLARKFKLAGANDYESAKCDEIIDGIRDFGQEWRPVMNEMDDVKKAELIQKMKEVVIPKYMGKLSIIIEQNGGKWLVGSNVTWADLALLHFVHLVTVRAKIDLCQGYPHVENLIKCVNSIPQIKEWMEKRPHTE